VVTFGYEKMQIKKRKKEKEERIFQIMTAYNTEK